MVVVVEGGRGRCGTSSCSSCSRATIDFPVGGVEEVDGGCSDSAMLGSAFTKGTHTEVRGRRLH